MTRSQQAAYEMEDALEDALQHLPGVETLEEQKSDQLDFHTISVLGLHAALEAAYKAGRDNEQARAERACRRNFRR